MLSVAAILSRVPIFRGLDAATLDAIAVRCQERTYPKGTVLFLEGDPAQGLFVVRKGGVKIYTSGTSGREQILEMEGPGRSVAELPLFDGLPYPASCAALEDTVVLYVARADFIALLERHPALSRTVIASLSQRLRRMVQLVHELSLVDVRGRLADLLLEMAGDEDTVELTVSNQDIAARIGTVREIVSRTFSRLSQEGILRVEGRTVRILDRARLRI